MIRIEPQPRADYHLHYDAAWLSRGDYLSDSGHVWSQPFETVAAEWPLRGQLHMLCTRIGGCRRSRPGGRRMSRSGFVPGRTAGSNSPASASASCAEPATR